MLKVTSLVFAGVLMLTGTAIAGGDKMDDKSRMSDGQTQEAIIPEEGQSEVTGETQETVIPGEEGLEFEPAQEEPMLDEGAGEEEAY